ncbi:MAG: MgtC/SapB family protein [Oceanicaulis sp.]
MADMIDWLNLPPQPASFWDAALRLAVAALLGAVIGFDREASQRPAGLRTNMLVSLAACLFTLTALSLVQSASEAGDAARADPIRVIEAVTAGVAFIAAGTIIRARASVQGVTTAAALWLAGAAGVTCGAGQFDLALAAVLLAVLVLACIGRIEAAVFSHKDEDQDWTAAGDPENAPEPEGEGNDEGVSNSPVSPDRQAER